ncbi:MAG: TatD family hydrolase [Chloroflexi bacterium]|nr:TatD family hydrolase [Chloroflexota bacterium]
MLATLDAHAHLDPSRGADELSASGAVLAMSLSLDEAERALQRSDPLIAWGVGCHPRFPRAQAGFDAQRFRSLAERTAIVGEVGLDTGSRVPLETQLKTFRQVLEIAAGMPRLVSIHSYRATSMVLDELEHCPVAIPVLHGWFGNVAETKRAVELGCYFSIHSQVARQSKFHNHVPLERVLVESDHGYNDPPAAIPCRVEWVEYLVAQQYGLEVEELRRVVWNNFTRTVHETDTAHLLSKSLVKIAEGL